MDYLSTGQPPEAHNPVVKLMGNIIVNMKSGVQENNIDQFERKPSLGYWFKNSSKGIPPQPITPHRHRGNQNQNQTIPPFVNITDWMINEK